MSRKRLTVELRVKTMSTLRQLDTLPNGEAVYEVPGADASPAVLWLQTSARGDDGRQIAGSLVAVRIGPKGGISIS